MSRRNRDLDPEERALWQKIAASARPLHPNRPMAPERAEKDHKLSPPKKARPTLAEFEIGQSASAVAMPQLFSTPEPHHHLARQPLRMDKRAHMQMLRGKLEPEARLDLHGMTLAEAHPELIRFVLNAQAQGLRLVLVITGKGKRGEDRGPIPQRMGALRHQVPHWLDLPPLRQAILQVSSANRKHGDTGAYYVYLRRRR
ncbi:MAG: Smr/MutS family protein [Paracoccaceae bacterium]